MKKTFFLGAYALVLVAHLAGMLLHEGMLTNVTKVLLLPLLLVYFLIQTSDHKDGIKKWIVFALFFSWVGDIVLLFQGEGEIYFLLGLSSFLLAHLFYIIFFHNIRVREHIKSRWIFLVIVIIYYATLITWLSPYLGDKRLPVRIYGIAISFMFLLALHMLYLRKAKSGIWMMLGALLFVTSDSILAIDKFYRPLPIAGFQIMITYGLAQLFITLGAAQYTRSGASK